MATKQEATPEPSKWESRKLILAVVGIVVVGALALFKVVTPEQFVDVLKWLITSYLGANALLGGLASLKK